MTCRRDRRTDRLGEKQILLKSVRRFSVKQFRMAVLPAFILLLALGGAQAQQTSTGVNFFDPCANLVCYNGGQCTAPADAPYCNCPPGFAGLQCENSVGGDIDNNDYGQFNDACRGFFCDNGGRCTAPQDVPYCICQQGFTGNRCQVRSGGRNPCNGFQCLNGGSCVALFGSPSCQCLSGYTGRRCENPTGNGNGLGQCPVVRPGSVGVCGGRFCTSDNVCRFDERCCDSACGGRLCTRVSQNQVSGPFPNNRCPQCAQGQVCVQRPRQCPPGRVCAQDLVPTCVQRGCENCRTNDQCQYNPRTNTYGCVNQNNNRCGQCPFGTQCVYVGQSCNDFFSNRYGTTPALSGGCRDLYECRQQRDACGGCPNGQVCRATGIQCARPPCPDFRCVVEDPDFNNPGVCPLRCAVGYKCAFRAQNCPIGVGYQQCNPNTPRPVCVRD